MAAAERSAARVKTRTATTLSTAANSATTPRLPAAMSVVSLPCQISCRPLPSPTSP